MNKMPMERWEEARGLAAVFKLNGELIVEGLGPRLAAMLEEGEEMPDLALLLDLFGRLIVAESDAVDEKDFQRLRESSERQTTGGELKEEVETLKERVSWVRKQMRHHYGAKETERLLEFKGRTPRKRKDLVFLATFMVRHLPNIRPARAAGIAVNPIAWAKELVEPTLRVRQQLRRLDVKNHTRSVAVKDMEAAMKAFDKTFRRLRRLAEIFLLLAGQERLARTLRRKGHRRPPEQKKASNVA